MGNENKLIKAFHQSLAEKCGSPFTRLRLTMIFFISFVYTCSVREKYEIIKERERKSG